MTKTVLTLLIILVAGCATTKAIVPALEGKPRIKINQQVPISTVPGLSSTAVPESLETPPEPIDTAPEPSIKETKGSKKNVRRKTKG